MPCIYEHQNNKGSDRLAPFESRIDDLESSTQSEIVASSVNTLDFSESRVRRLRELRLLHHYSTKAIHNFSSSAVSTVSSEIWTILLPELAFKNDALLNSLLCLSALHLAKTGPNEAEAKEIHQNYLDLAVRGHSNDVAHASKENADILCLTSSLLRACAFSALEERSLDPYVLPMSWLQMTHGTGRVFHAVWDWVSDNEESMVMRILNRPPILTPFNEELWAESNRQGFQHLLDRSPADVANEPWDSSIQEAYSSTLSYIGSIQIAITAKEEPENTGRRILAFPCLISREYVDLVEEKRPRALTVLAYYFALLARFRKSLWWAGDSGRREVRGIQTMLPAEWQEQMSWPLRTMEEVSPESL